MRNGKHIENFFYYIIFLATDLVLIELWQIICWIVGTGCVCVCGSVCLLGMIVKNEKKEENETVEIVKTWGRIPGALCLVWNFQLFRINFCCSCCQQNISIPKCSQLLTLARLSATPPLLLPPVPPYHPVLISMPHKMIIKQQFAARKKIWNFSTARMLLCVCVCEGCVKNMCVCVCV